MTRASLLLAAATLGTAAAPSRGLDTTAAAPTFSLQAPAPPLKSNNPPGFTPAPMPNLDASAPSNPRQSNDAQIAPSLFSRRDQYRGEGYSAGSSAQSQQERRVQPGAGVNLRVPLQ